jgi:hypothetical protein
MAEKSAEHRIPVIYVLSSGRSGSTLLDLLLGQHPEIWTLGEAQILPWELRENRRPCGCGTSIQECDFWKPILPNLPLDQGDHPIEHFREKHNAGRVLRPRQLSEILLRHQSRESMSASREYAQLNAEYFATVWAAAQDRRDGEVRWLVDASKDVYRLWWLERSGYFDLWVIHLMKDPRAFVYSMVKRNPKSLRRAIRFAGRWVVENLTYAYVCASAALKGRTFRVRYEDLADKPGDTLQGIWEWLQADSVEFSRNDFRHYENHAVSGNPMRWQNTHIFLDEEWRRELPGNRATLVWIATGFLARRFGYSV